VCRSAALRSEGASAGLEKAESWKLQLSMSESFAHTSLHCAEYCTVSHCLVTLAHRIGLCRIAHPKALPSLPRWYTLSPSSPSRTPSRPCHPHNATPPAAMPATRTIPMEDSASSRRAIRASRQSRSSCSTTSTPQRFVYGACAVANPTAAAP
jgi:hypothetical protein